MPIFSSSAFFSKCFFFFFSCGFSKVLPFHCFLSQKLVVVLAPFHCFLSQKLVVVLLHAYPGLHASRPSIASIFFVCSSSRGICRSGTAAIGIALHVIQNKIGSYLTIWYHLNKQNKHISLVLHVEGHWKIWEKKTHHNNYDEK